MASNPAKIRNILDTSILSANANTAHQSVLGWNDARYVPILDLLISILDDLIYPKNKDVQEAHPNSDETLINNGTNYMLNLGIHSGRSTGLFADFDNSVTASAPRSERQRVIDTIVKVLKQAQFQVIQKNSFSEDKSVMYSTLEWQMMEPEIGIDIWELKSLTEVWFVLLAKRHTLTGERDIWVLSNKSQENLKKAMKLMAQQGKVAPLSSSAATVKKSGGDSATNDTTTSNDSNDKNVSDNNKDNDKNDKKNDTNENDKKEEKSGANVAIDRENKMYIMYSQLANYILSLNDEFTVFDRLNNFTFGNIDINANHAANMVLSDYFQNGIIEKVLSKFNDNKSLKLNIIDMGCGWGNVGRAFKHKDIAYKEGILCNDISKYVTVNLHGLDSNEKMLQIGKVYKYNEYYTKYPKPKNNELYSFQQCDCQRQRIPFKDHTIDGIISVNYLLANNTGVLSRNNSGFGEFVELPSKWMKKEIYRVLRHPAFGKKPHKKKDQIPAFICLIFQCLHPNIRVLDVDIRNVFMPDDYNPNGNANANNDTSQAEDMKNNDNNNNNGNLKNEDFGLKLVKSGRLKEYIYGIWEHKLLAEIDKEKDAVSAMMRHEEYQVLREQLAHLNMTVDDDGSIIPISQSMDTINNGGNSNANASANSTQADEDVNATMSSA